MFISHSSLYFLTSRCNRFICQHAYAIVRVIHTVFTYWSIALATVRVNKTRVWLHHIAVLPYRHWQWKYREKYCKWLRFKNRIKEIRCAGVICRWILKIIFMQDKRYKTLTLRRLMSYIYIYIYIYIYGAPILDVSRSHTTTQHSR